MQDDAYGEAFSRVAMTLGYAHRGHVEHALAARNRGDQRPLWLALVDAAEIPFDVLDLIERKVEKLKDPCPDCGTVRYRYLKRVKVAVPCPVCEPGAAVESPLFARAKPASARRSGRADEGAKRAGKTRPAAPASKRTKPEAKPSAGPAVKPGSGRSGAKASAAPRAWTSVPGMFSAPPLKKPTAPPSAAPEQVAAGAGPRPPTARHDRPSRRVQRTRRSVRPPPRDPRRRTSSADDHNFVPVFHADTGPRKKPRKLSRALVYVLLAVFAFAFVMILEHLNETTLPAVDRALAPAPPLIGAAERGGRWRYGDFQLRPVAGYRVRAVVLAARQDPGPRGRVIPYELALGWGELSNPRRIAEARISIEGHALTVDGLGETSADYLGMIPANAVIGSLFAKQVRPGSIVELVGTLVDVEGAGTSWSTGTGPGEAKLIWVRQLQLE